MSAWIRMIPPEEATGRLAELYERVKKPPSRATRAHGADGPPAVDNSVPGAVRATPSAVTLSASLAPVTTICATPASRAGEHLLAVAIKRLVAEICTDVDEIHVNPPGPERGVQRHGASPHFSPPLRRGRGSDGIDRVEAARAPNVLSSTPASPDSRSPQPAKSISAPRFATR